jgi:8-oxo-dGTP pyrophosphatase MutT (NUDIX family)
LSRGARQAAVVFVLYRSDDRWTVPFVRRRADLRDHPGQVALPGGGVKPGETAWAAAQREVAEEIGVSVGRLVPIGAGEPFYTAVSNFSVLPFVAHLPDPVPIFVHDEHELDGVLAIPLERLLDDGAWLQSAEPWRFRYLAHEESVVWGLTERIVAGLAPRLKQALAGDQTMDPPAPQP